jgi:predicted transcriptional regulator
MQTSPEASLTRRERQIMDILFAAGRATGPEIQQRLPDCPTYSTVRTLLRVLERKGYVRHSEEGLRYVYTPVLAREAARRSALQRVLQTFFDGSARQVIAALLDPKVSRLSPSELDELTELIDKAKRNSAAGPLTKKEKR